MYEIAVVGAGVVGGGRFRIRRGIRVRQDRAGVGLYPGPQFDVFLIESDRGQGGSGRQVDRVGW